MSSFRTGACSARRWRAEKQGRMVQTLARSLVCYFLVVHSKLFLCHAFSLWRSLHPLPSFRDGQSPAGQACLCRSSGSVNVFNGARERPAAILSSTSAPVTGGWRAPRRLDVIQPVFCAGQLLQR
ncbi:hypothetical protein BCR35DRAFT_300529 [Leucosporidium creatinivorum]|uniref:Uncharacterized protein n=1 Tax=Leucosporidium creatinivorum TaxID=106004 RepID=A0A1Y2FZ17_9BASI|nr:hypothetical protein BCR35DRAFT_300529 [Leucosporidium creatinivorum]